MKTVLATSVASNGARLRSDFSTSRSAASAGLSLPVLRMTSAAISRTGWIIARSIADWAAAAQRGDQNRERTSSLDRRSVQTSSHATANFSDAGILHWLAGLQNRFQVAICPWSPERDRLNARRGNVLVCIFCFSNGKTCGLAG